MRVALVHDWLVTQRGGENVLLEIARFFSEAPIYTLVHAPGAVDPELERRRIITSFIQGLPGAPRSFRRYLPLFPRAIESFDLSSFDLIISTSHCVAKGVRVRPGQLHLTYVHSPMRYLWDQLPHYLPGGGRWRWVLEPIARVGTAPLRRWDRRSSARPTHLLGNSDFVVERIARCWGREAERLYPPVDVSYFEEGEDRERGGYLVVSALVPYKRVDLAVRWARESGESLTVVGNGAELPRLRALGGDRVVFVTDASRSAVREAYRGARGLLFCGVEDFGIVPLEAMAAGCPVVALGEGGALETVVGEGPEATGVFFKEPTVRSLAEAVERLEAGWLAGGFRRSDLQARARRFSEGVFRAGFGEILEKIGALAPN